MEKFRKKTVIEVVGITPEGYLVQNEGNPSDQWVIEPDTFDATYEKLQENTGVSIEESISANQEYLLLELMRCTTTEDFDFRDKVKAKLEKILNL